MRGRYVPRETRPWKSNLSSTHPSARSNPPSPGSRLRISVWTVSSNSFSSCACCVRAAGLRSLVRSRPRARQPVGRNAPVISVRSSWRLHNYHETYKTLPPAYIADANGKPMHSWRMLIMPFMEQSTLYNQYDFSEPWNGPNNIKLLDSMPSNPRLPEPVQRADELDELCGRHWTGNHVPRSHFGQVRRRHRWALEHADGCRGRKRQHPLDGALGP